MHFIKEEKFISLFHKEPTDFEFFCRNAKVKRGDNGLTSLSEYAKKKEIKTDDLHLLFQNIQNRNDYLKRFYKKSLKIPDNNQIQITEPPMKNKMDNNKLSNYKNIIRNLHYLDILKNTKSGFHNVETFMKMLENLYIKNIIDYKLLTPSAIHYMNKGRIGSIFSSFYFRASIMNPYLIYSLNKTALNGTKIFTPTLGWTSYLYGFLECSEVDEYVGTDVIKSVCDKTRTFAKTFYPSKKVEIFNCMSEKLLSNLEFREKYKSHFDVVFFSPPYYDLEIYPGLKQSVSVYKTYGDWLSDYWEKTIQLCHYVLKKKGKICYIISDYGSHNTKNKHNLVSDMNEVTKKYFEVFSIQNMYDKNPNLKEHTENVEKICVFLKK